MFANIPQKLSSPFGILGDDAKLQFRTQASGIRKLADVKNISETDVYWDQYAVLFDSPSDVFSLISPNDIRRALNECPKNVETLVHKLSTRLFNLLVDHTFPSPPPSTVPSLTSITPSFLRGTAGLNNRNTTKELLNCLRVLSRVLPVIFEGDNQDFEARLLWTREEAKVDTVEEATAQGPQFVIDDDEDVPDDSGGQTVQSPTSTTAPNVTKKTHPSLAERLISCSIDLLFCCSFTLPPKIQVDHHKINYAIWETGVGSTVDLGSNHQYDSNKVEVLRFVLVLLSRQMYISPAHMLSTPSPYTTTFIRDTPRRHVLTILCSLLNTAMHSGHNNGGGMVNVAANLPYNHLVFKGEDNRVSLVGACLQVLCILLDFQSGGARDAAAPNEPSSSTPSAKSNAFRYFLAKLHRSNDFGFILDGVIGILQHHMSAVHNILPGSVKPVPHLLETVIFFWKMIELNKKFRAYLLDTDKGMIMLTYLLCYCMEVKDKPQQHGLCRALSYIVQTLSAERAFGEKLGSPIKVPLPARWNITGTVADFMISSVYSVVATTSGNLNALYPAFIIALSNSAPYFKNLSVASSNRLVQLFTAFKNPMFLLSDEGHPRLLFFILEVFNGIITHQLSENPNLVYAILRSHKAFEDLGTFTLSGGLREVKRVQKAKEEQAARSGVPGDKEGRNAQSETEQEKLLQSNPRTEVIFSAPDDDVESGTQVDSLNSSANAQEPPRSPSPPRQSGEAQSPSEKARGKMPERTRSASLDTTSSLERIAAAGIGRNGFIPTQEWVSSWQIGLPLDVVLLTISELMPKIQELQTASSKANTVPQIIDFLQAVNLQEVLPPKAPFSPRRFQWSDASIVWLTSLIWGEIYVKAMTPLGIWNGTNVKLFYVKHSQTHNRQIRETVSQVVGGLGGFLSRGNSQSEMPPSAQRRNSRMG